MIHSSFVSLKPFLTSLKSAYPVTLLLAPLIFILLGKLDLQCKRSGGKVCCETSARTGPQPCSMPDRDGGLQDAGRRRCKLWMGSYSRIVSSWRAGQG